MPATAASDAAPARTSACADDTNDTLGAAADAALARTVAKWDISDVGPFLELRRTLLRQEKSAHDALAQSMSRSVQLSESLSAVERAALALPDSEEDTERIGRAAAAARGSTDGLVQRISKLHTAIQRVQALESAVEYRTREQEAAAAAARALDEGDMASCARTLAAFVGPSAPLDSPPPSADLGRVLENARLTARGYPAEDRASVLPRLGLVDDGLAALGEHAASSAKPHVSAATAALHDPKVMAESGAHVRIAHKLATAIIHSFKEISTLCSEAYGRETERALATAGSILWNSCAPALAQLMGGLEEARAFNKLLTADEKPVRVASQQFSASKALRSALSSSDTTVPEGDPDHVRAIDGAADEGVLLLRVGVQLAQRLSMADAAREMPQRDALIGSLVALEGKYVRLACAAAMRDALANALAALAETDRQSSAGASAQTSSFAALASPAGRVQSGKTTKAGRGDGLGSSSALRRSANASSSSRDASGSGMGSGTDDDSSAAHQSALALQRGVDDAFFVAQRSVQRALKTDAPAATGAALNNTAAALADAVRAPLEDLAASSSHGAAAAAAAALATAAKFSRRLADSVRPEHAVVAAAAAEVRAIASAFDASARSAAREAAAPHASAISAGLSAGDRNLADLVAAEAAAICSGPASAAKEIVAEALAEFISEAVEERLFAAQYDFDAAIDMEREVRGAAANLAEIAGPPARERLARLLQLAEVLAAETPDDLEGLFAPGAPPRVITFAEARRALMRRTDLDRSAVTRLKWT